MTERYDNPELVDAIAGSVPLASDEPVILGSNGVDRFVVMSARRYARLSELAPDPRRAVSLETMSAEDAAEIVAAIKEPRPARRPAPTSRWTPSSCKTWDPAGKFANTHLTQLFGL